MSSHFSSIGFPITTMEEAEDIANRVAPEATAITVEEGTYLRWAPGSGEELWVLRNRRGRLIGLNPHFTGPSSVRVGLIERIQRPEDSARSMEHSSRGPIPTRNQKTASARSSSTARMR